MYQSIKTTKALDLRMIFFFLLLLIWYNVVCDNANDMSCETTQCGSLIRDDITIFDDVAHGDVAMWDVGFAWRWLGIAWTNEVTEFHNARLNSTCMN